MHLARLPCSHVAQNLHLQLPNFWLDVPEVSLLEEQLRSSKVHQALDCEAYSASYTKAVVLGIGCSLRAP